MKIDINERNENALLEREEITLSVDHTGEATPSENALRKQLAAELDLDPLTIQVDHIYSPSGAARSTAQVTVFEEPIMDELPEDDADDAGEDVEEAAEDGDADEEDAEEDAAEDADEIEEPDETGDDKEAEDEDNEEEKEEVADEDGEDDEEAQEEDA